MRISLLSYSCQFRHILVQLENCFSLQLSVAENKIDSVGMGPQVQSTEVELEFSCKQRSSVK